MAWSAMAATPSTLTAHLVILPTPVTSAVSAPAQDVRDWIRGYGLLPGNDPQQYLTDDMPVAAAALGKIMNAA